MGDPGNLSRFANPDNASRFTTPAIGVHFFPEQRVFRLQTKNTTYAFRVDDTRNLEHLYWGPTLNQEDDLLYLAMANAVTMFDPVGEVSAARILGLDELEDILHDENELTERWKIYTKQKDQPEDQAKARRLENASWRLWTRERFRGGDLNRDLSDGTLLSALKVEDMPAIASKAPPAESVGTDDDLRRTKTMEAFPSSPALPTARSISQTPDMKPRNLQEDGDGHEHGPLHPLRSVIDLRSFEHANKHVGSVSTFTAIDQDHGEPVQVSMNWNKLDPELIGKNTKLLEFSDRGTGDYREPSFKVKYEDGSEVAPMEYRSHRIVKGKPAPKDCMPHVFVDSIEEATTLIVEMVDQITKLCIELHFTVMHNYDSIIRKAVVINRTNAVVKLESVMSCTVDFDADEYHLTMLSGGWARERQIVQRSLVDGLTQFKSSRGASSHQFNPFMAISKQREPSENGPTVYAFTLVYSGNFAAMAEVSESSRLRVNMGINPENFQWRLDLGASFTTPDVIMTCSEHGLGGTSRDLHRLMRNCVMPTRWRHERCPVLINTWEAVYFNVTHETVLEIARHAAKADVEMIVLDDGWFGKRDNINSGLGDWFVNRQKFPYGLERLGRELNEIGMKFGIWVEPEMVNYDSDLHREHSDWTLHVPTRGRTTGRNQFVLDFSRADVRDYIVESLSNLLKSANIEYVKWDMNRHLTEVFSQQIESERQGEVSHRFIMGVYEVLSRITSAFPNVFLETCSGGGGRFDAGMLFYSPQIWCSDNTDAVSRTLIQYGTSLAYPIRSMGSHVSTVPNHQTFRSAPLKTRVIVAMTGSFGFELDPREWNDEAVAEIKGYVTLYKVFAPLINNGDFYRLWSPFKTKNAAWMFVSEDQTEAVVMALNITREVGRLNPLLRLEGLSPDTVYSIQELLPGYLTRNMSTGAIEVVQSGVYQYNRVLEISGSTLMKAGLPIKFMFDADSLLLHLQAKK